MDALVHADMALRAWVVGHRVGVLDGLMWLLSAAGRGGMLFVALAAAVSVRRRSAREFLVTAAAIVVTAAVVDHVVKPLVGRDRPFVVSPAPAVIGSKPDDPSFPSGHAGNAFAGAFALSQTVPGGAPCWWALAVAVAYSRVYLGVHYPGDVIAGALLGLLAAAAVSVGARAWQRSRGSG